MIENASIVPLDRVKLLETVLSATADFNYLFDRYGRFLYTNNALANLLQRTPESFIGKNFHDLGYPRELATKLQDQIQTVLNTGKQLVDETPFTNPAGKIGFYEYVFVPVFNDQQQVQMVAGSTRDITDRKNAQMALAQSDAQIKNIFESINEAFVGLDPDFKFNYINPTGENLYGMKREEVLGKNIWEMFPQAVGSEAYDIYHRAMKTRTQEHFEFFYDGWNKWLDIKVYPASQGGLAIYFSDITARRQSEENLKKVADELLRSNKELEAFAYISSHDLKEPLRKISNYADLLAIANKEKLDANSITYLDRIATGAKRMNNLIENLLAFSRLGQKEPVRVLTDLNGVLAHVRSDLEPRILETGAEITCDKLPSVKADATQMYQVFQNLISNAIKFRAEGKPPRIHVASKTVGNETVISLSDNGIGIDKQYAERIFEIFQRLHTGEKYPGTGIGLAICKKIVDGHGGRIWMESDLGKGSTFHFTLK